MPLEDTFTTHYFPQVDLFSVTVIGLFSRKVSGYPTLKASSNILLAGVEEENYKNIVI